MSEEQASLLPPQEPDIHEQIVELERELEVRRRCYPDWVSVGRIKPTVAAYRMRCLELAIENLQVQASTQSFGVGV